MPQNSSSTLPNGEGQVVQLTLSQGTIPSATPSGSGGSSEHSELDDQRQNAYDELIESLAAFLSVVEAETAALPKEFVRTLRPVRGCIHRLGQVLSSGKEEIQQTLTMLGKLLADVHNARSTLPAGSAGDLGDRLDRALYDLGGAMLVLGTVV